MGHLQERGQKEKLQCSKLELEMPAIKERSTRWTVMMYGAGTLASPIGEVTAKLYPLQSQRRSLNAADPSAPRGPGEKPTRESLVPSSRVPFHLGRIVFCRLADWHCKYFEHWKEHTHKKANSRKEREGREERKGEREIAAGVVSKKGPPETENLLFPEFVSCRACEVNGFGMKWIYEGVARSQDAWLSDCFVNSISLKFGLIFKTKKKIFLSVHLLFPGFW